MWFCLCLLDEMLSACASIPPLMIQLQIIIQLTPAERSPRIPPIYWICWTLERLFSDRGALKLSLCLRLLPSNPPSPPASLSLTVIPPVSRNAVVFNFSQLLWLAAQPPAFPHLFPIRPLRSPHKQSLSLWPPASHQVSISKHGDFKLCALDHWRRHTAPAEPIKLPTQRPFLETELLPLGPQKQWFTFLWCSNTNKKCFCVPLDSDICIFFTMHLNCVMTKKDLDASVCLCVCVLLQAAPRLHFILSWFRVQRL